MQVAASAAQFATVSGNVFTVGSADSGSLKIGEGIAYSFDRTLTESASLDDLVVPCRIEYPDTTVDDDWEFAELTYAYNSGSPTLTRTATRFGSNGLSAVSFSGTVVIRGALADFETIGEPWHEVGGTGEPAYENSWVAFDTARKVKFRRVGNVVIITGTVKNGSSANAVIFTLPTDYRPAGIMNLPAYSNSGAARVDIATNGEVNVPVGGDTAFTFINCSYSL